MTINIQPIHRMTTRHTPAATAAPEPLLAAPGDARYTGGWEELLSDLSCLGEVGIEVQGRAVVTSRRLALAGMRVTDGVGHLRSGGTTLRLLLDDLRGLHASKTDAWALNLTDGDAKIAATLRADPQDGSGDLVWRALLATHDRISRGTAPAPGPVGTGCATRAGQLRDLGRRSKRIDDGLDFLDVAELAGLLLQCPSRLHDRGEAVRVDAGLVPCVLWSVVDHLVPIQVTVGNGALLQRLAFSPFTARLDCNRQCLLAERTRVSLDFREVAHAWVFRPHRRHTREIRLYDRDGRAVAVIGPQEDPAGREPCVWRVLVDALLA